MSANPWPVETVIAVDQKSLHVAMDDPSLTANKMDAATRILTRLQDFTFFLPAFRGGLPKP